MKHSLAWVVGLLATVATGFGASIGGPSSGSSGGAATNAVATIAKDGSTIVSGALAIDFTNAASTVVTVSADGTTARVGIPQGGSGGGGGTNFPNVNLLVGNTNLAVVAGIEYAAYQVTNAAFTANIQQSGAFQSGQLVGLIVSNSSGSDFEVTIYTNSVAANPYDIATKTNVNTFTASASAVTEARLKYVSAGRWELERIFGPTAILKFGEGTIRDTNGVNGLDIVLSTRRYTNYASASITINCATDVTANYTNAVAANNTITLATPVIGTSGSLGLVSDGSARTLAILAPVAITWLSTNDTANATNILTTADKRSLFAWRVGMGTDGVSTNIHCWVKNQTP